MSLRSLWSRIAQHVMKKEIADARKKGSAVMSIVDGNKRLLFILGFIVSGMIGVLTGQDVTQWTNYGLETLGWQDDVLRAEATRIATLVVPLLLAVWAATSALLKMYKQFKAGAKIVELNKPIAVVKAALADGTLTVVAAEPVLLRVAENEKAPAVALVAPPAPPEVLAAPLPVIEGPTLPTDEAFRKDWESRLKR